MISQVEYFQEPIVVVEAMKIPRIPNEGFLKFLEGTKTFVTWYAGDNKEPMVIESIDVINENGSQTIGYAESSYIVKCKHRGTFAVPIDVLKETHKPYNRTY